MDKTEVSETTYYTIFEACQEGILVVNPEGKIVITNNSLRLMFGYDQNEIEGRKVEELIPHQYRHRHVEHRDRYMENPVPRRMGHGRDLVGLRKNNTIFPLEASLSKVHLYGIEHTVAYIIDITARKEMEDALRRSEEQLVEYATELERRVKARTEQLLNANKDLEEEMKVRKKAESDAKKALGRERELNELKSRFVSMASHEFRTPLSTIKSSASLIEKYNKEEQADKRDKHVLKIKNSIDHLNDILDDFLSLARLEEGKINTNFIPVNFNMILENITEEMEPIVKEGQTIKADLNLDKPVISDAKIIKNIMINLLSNAIKYSPENSQIGVKAHRSGKNLEISVSDSGMGIPKADQGHLFERFFRAHNAINIKGTGLGLHIVQKYVDLLGGIITFESIENKGTTFIVTIPIPSHEKNSDH
ncbi:MAG: PAS domain-containing sensor histidine kinase [Cyclobacteriaceae bacterium]